jgi:predicted DNA-binding transcriptional regulator YafY
MTYSERKQKENHLLYLIKNERLYSLEKVASDYQCSVRTLKRMLNNLREEGYDIAYCRKKNNYFIKK